MTIRTRKGIEQQIAAKLADNTSGDISAQDVREVLTDVNDSSADLRDTIWRAYYYYEDTQSTVETFASLDLSSRQTLAEIDATNSTGYGIGYIFTYDESNSDREFNIQFNVANKSTTVPETDNWDAYPSNAQPFAIRARANTTYAWVVIISSSYFLSIHADDPDHRWVPALVGHGGTTPTFDNFTSQMFHLSWQDELQAPSIDLYSADQTLNAGDNDTTYKAFANPIDPATHPVINMIVNPSSHPNYMLALDLHNHTAVTTTNMYFPSDHLKLVWIDDDVPPLEAQAGSINGDNGWEREMRFAPVKVAGSLHMIGGLYCQWLINGGTTSSLKLKDVRARSSRV